MCCDVCDKWNHPDCEIEHGEDEQYRVAAAELKQKELDEAKQLENGEQPGLELSDPEAAEKAENEYTCVKCRK